MEPSPPPLIPPTQETPPAPSEEERAKDVEQHLIAGGRYIDGTETHRAAQNLLEERDIQHFAKRQRLLKILYHLTDPPPKAAPSPTPKPLPPQPSSQKPVPLPVIEIPEHHASDIGGEGGV